MRAVRSKRTHFKVAKASAAAIKTIEAAGGSVEFCCPGRIAWPEMESAPRDAVRLTRSAKAASQKLIEGPRDLGRVTPAFATLSTYSTLILEAKYAQTLSPPTVSE